VEDLVEADLAAAGLVGLAAEVLAAAGRAEVGSGAPGVPARLDGRDARHSTY
jgi:hypothetical protein